MNSSLRLRQSLYKAFSVLAALEGVIAFVFLFQTRSMERNAWLFGYSPLRLSLGLVTLALLAFFAWYAGKALRDAAWLDGTIARLEALAIHKDRLLSLTVLLLCLLMASLALLLGFSQPLAFESGQILGQASQALPRLYDILRALIERARPMLVWLLLLTIQALAVLLVSFLPVYRQKLADGSIFRTLLAMVIAGAAAFHWTVLIFRLKTFLVVAGWKWYFWEKETAPPGWLFPVLFALGIGAIFLALKLRRRWQLALLVLILAGYTLQVGFGFMAGQGYESLRLKYADSVFNNYAWAAAEEPPPLQALTEYEARYGGDWYLGTKPPGLLLVYIATQKVAHLFQPQATLEGRFVGLTSFAAHLFPLIAFLALIALFHFGKYFQREKEDALLPGILYITCPSVLLIPLFLDQVLFPLLFLLALYAVLQTINRRSYALAFFSGGLIYTLFYFSFSLLPLLPLAAAWISIDHLLNHRRQGLFKTLKLLAALALGVVIFYLLFYLTLNYDFFLRYSNAMAQHRLAKEFEPGLRQILDAIVLNTVELSTWNGFPILLLFLARTARGLWALVKRRATSLDGFLAAFLLTYLALNLFGQTNGEVQRLWLFLLPPVVLFAAEEARKLFRHKESGILFIAALQLVTTYLIFTYQDFYG